MTEGQRRRQGQRDNGGEEKVRGRRQQREIEKERDGRAAQRVIKGKVR